MRCLSSLVCREVLGTLALAAALAFTAPVAVARGADRESKEASPSSAQRVASRSARPAGPAAAKPRAAVAAKRPDQARKAAAPSGKRARSRVARSPAVPSVGRLAGLHQVDDPLDLKSGVALVVDQERNEVLLSKNPDAVLPIASITKLMTALVVVESGLPLEQSLTIDPEDAAIASSARSKLVPGTSMSRGEMLRLALMASENRAAHALSRHFPGGLDAFVAAMNLKARELGMLDTRFVEATGLSSDNRASAHDLARLVAAAADHHVIREYSTAKESLVPVGVKERVVQFRSTNGLIGSPDWDISLQKTGYIAAAGRCLVMKATLAGRDLTLVLLDSAGRYSRMADAERIRRWVLEGVPSVPTALLPTPTVR